jgi:hypothetical protein
MMPPVEAAKTQFKISYQLAGLHFDQMIDYAENFQRIGVNARAEGIVISYKQKLDTTITNEINRRNQERLRLRLFVWSIGVRQPSVHLDPGRGARAGVAWAAWCRAGWPWSLASAAPL